ncbi:MAG: hypothetical protein R3D45_00405 [Rhizobiaceae bacterium]
MDWQLAIERNREALGRVIASLVPLAEMMQSLTVRRPLAVPSRLALLAPQDEGNGPRRADPRPLHRFIARILRPAESALRRLIVIVAAALQARATTRLPLEGRHVRPSETTVERVGVTERRDGNELPPPGSVSHCEPVADLPSRGRLGTYVKPLPDFTAFARGQKLPAFALIDPRKRFGEEAKFSGSGRTIPRVSVPGFIDPEGPAKPDHDVRVEYLLRRIGKLDHALKTLPRQARRLNKLMARRSKAEPGQGGVGPLRPGPPPGYKRRSHHEVHAILGECHFLALECGFKPP